MKNSSFVATIVSAVVIALGACSIDKTQFTQTDASGTTDGGIDSPPGVVELVVSTLTLDVGEAAQGTFTVALSNPPSAAVLVNLTSSNDAKLTVSPAALLFQPADFATMQTVTVTGKEDDDTADEVQGIDVVAPGIDAETVAVTVADNDGLGIITTPAIGVDVTEGDTTTLKVRLSAQPPTNMLVTLVSGNPTAATIAPSMLGFTMSNWDIDQSVTISGLNDANTTNDNANLAITGAGLADVAVAITVFDDDVLGIDPSTTTLAGLTEGGTSSFTVRLSQLPPADVTVNVASTNPAALDVTQPSLTFTTTNWSTPQTVNVTLPQDVDTANDTAMVSLTATGLTTRTISASIADDDTQAIVVSPNPIVVGEGASAMANVHLAFKPAQDIMLATSSLNSVATVSPAMLTFTPANYATNQPLTVSGVEDANAAPESGTIHLDSITTTLVRDVPVTVNDNDTLGLEVSTATVSLAEGGTSTFQVRLTAQPLADTTVNVNSADTSAATAAPPSMVFSTTNWNTYQTVTVTGVEDIDLGGESVVITASASGLASKTVTATVTDNDMQQILVTMSTVNVGEGASVNVGVSLMYQPAANASVTIASNNMAVATAAPGSLTFTPANFSTAQNFSVTGSQDANTTAESTTLTVSSSGATNVTVNVSVADDDTLAIVTNVPSVSVTEGSTAMFQVKLSAMPAATTTVMLASNDAGAATVAPTMLTFTTGNYGTYQNVTVTGVDDADTTDETAMIILSSTGLGNVNVGVNVVDNDTLSIITTAGSVSLGESGSTTFGVHLSAMPAGNVTVNVVSGDTGAATVGPSSLSFTTGNYAIDQTITVTGVGDADLANESVSITCSASGLANRIVTATVTDDDSQEVLVNGMTTTSLSVTEGSTNTFAVTLRYVPSGTVMVAVVSNNTAAATVSAATLTFNAGNYNTAQNITVTGVGDANATNESTTITATLTGASTGTVNTTVVDDDIQNIVISTSALNVSEIANGTFNVHLAAQPAANTTVTIMSGDTSSATVTPPSMTFTTATWNVDQVVTVSGVNDADLAHESLQVTLASAGLSNKLVTVAVADDDLISVSPTGITLCEGASTNLATTLGGPPFGGAVTITLMSGPLLSTSPTSHNFSAQGTQNATVTAGFVTTTQSSSVIVGGPMLTSRTVNVTIRDSSSPACVVCGDSVCSGSETPASCLEDCPSVCGDTYCTVPESPTSCPGDCGGGCIVAPPSGSKVLLPPPMCCGDGTCTSTEYFACTCPADCGPACP